MTEKQTRTAMAHAMERTVANNTRWHYAEVRPLTIPAASQAYGGTVYSDCSFGCKIIAHLAGAPDPTGLGFSGYGNSTSMYDTLEHIDRQDIQPGDYAVFGRHGNEHACVIYRLAADPMVWNMGAPGQPVFRKLSAEIATHGPVTYLRGVPKDKPAPSPPAPKVSEPAKAKTTAKKAAKPRYYTLKKDVPLRKGQTVHFTRGKGYYAA